MQKETLSLAEREKIALKSQVDVSQREICRVKDENERLGVLLEREREEKDVEHDRLSQKIRTLQNEVDEQQDKYIQNQSR